MSLSNLPPGVTENMIPGNRPEDEAWDAFWDQYNFFDPLLEWSYENNPMLYTALLFIEKQYTSKTTMIGNPFKDLKSLNKIAFDIVEECQDDLPIEKWFEDWCGAMREGPEE